MIQLPQLPFDFWALEPYIDAQTVEIHYTKHHQWYVNKLNDLIKGTPFENQDLKNIVKTAENWPIFNNAAQIRNHTFYRNSVRKPQENNIPTGNLATAIQQKRWSFQACIEAFSISATNNFGSGRTRLVKNTDNSLEIINTSNAQTPLTTDKTPLLTIDIREHAYYLKYQNRRPEYINNFQNIINRDFAENNYNN